MPSFFKRLNVVFIIVIVSRLDNRKQLDQTIIYYECVTFFERSVADFVRAVALGRYERLRSAAGWIGHRARDHSLSVLRNCSRVHDEIGRRA